MPYKQTLKPPPARYRVIEIWDNLPPQRRFARAVVELAQGWDYHVYLTNTLSAKRLIPVVTVRILRGGNKDDLGTFQTLRLVRLRKMKPLKSAICNCDTYNFPHAKGRGRCPN